MRRMEYCTSKQRGRTTIAVRLLRTVATYGIFYHNYTADTVKARE
jgi:hypothetical protein